MRPRSPRTHAGERRLHLWLTSPAGYHCWRVLCAFTLFGALGLPVIAQGGVLSPGVLAPVVLGCALLTSLWIFAVPGRDPRWPASGSPGEQFPSEVVAVSECVGWKAARLAHTEGELHLWGVAGGMYQGRARGVCLRDGGHPVPAVGCSCGFHAWHTRTAARAYQHQLGPGAVLLQVELVGAILEYERGVRAEEQEVLGVLLPATCTCGQPNQVVSLPPDGAAGQCGITCEVCASGEPISLAAIRSSLGCEVGWDESLPTPGDQAP